MTDADVLIVGGGISGLSIGWLLANAGVDVEVWEQSDQPGGKIQTQRRCGYLLEDSASMVLNFRPEVGRFLAAAGLNEHKIERAPTEHRYLLKDGDLVKLPLNFGAMIKSPVWNTGDKLRMMIEPFTGRGDQEQETVSQFVTRRLGQAVLDLAIEPFVAGPLAADPDRANAAATLPRLTGLERRYGSITMGMLAHLILRRRTATETEAFSFAGGMSTLTEMLAQVSPVRNADLGGLLRGIAYAPVSVVHTGFDQTAINHPLNGTGFLVPRREKLALTGCMWSSRLFPGHAHDGKVLLTNYIGGSRRPEAVGWGDDQSITEISKVLRPLLGISRDPEMVAITRHPRALPLYYGAYPARMRAMDEHLQGLTGLHLAANYRGGVSIRDRIACAYESVERILSELHRSPKEAGNKKSRSSSTVMSPSADMAR